MINDMTEGKPAKQLILFSLPMLLSSVFQQLYNMADSVIAGQFAGKDALSAVGASFPVTMIFMAIATGANIGCCVIVSQLFGAKETVRMKTAITTSLLAVCALSVLLTAAGFVSCSGIMTLLNTPPEIFSDSLLYLQVYIGGLFFLFLYNICTGIFTALGDSRTPLYFLIASSLGNILLDLFFVAVLHMGVSGVAWATFIAQGAASLLSAAVLFKRLKAIQTQEKAPVFSWRTLGNISVVAVPSILQQSFISVGNLFIQGLVNGYGSDVIAGYSAAIRLNTFAITSFTTLANGVSSFTAQYVGARKLGRIRAGFRTGVGMVLCAVLPFALLFVFFGQEMIGLFVSAEDLAAVAPTGVQFLQIVSPFYFVVALKLVADGVLRGAGSMVLFMITTFTDLILRVVLAFVMAPAFGAAGIWWSWPVGWAVASALSIAFYFVLTRRLHRRFGAQEEQSEKFVGGC